MFGIFCNYNCIFVGASASTMLSPAEFVSEWRSQGHLGGIAHSPHPVVVGISTNLFVREETVSSVCTCSSVSRVSSILVLFHAYTVHVLRFCFW